MKKILHRVALAAMLAACGLADAGTQLAAQTVAATPVAASGRVQARLPQAVVPGSPSLVEQPCLNCFKKRYIYFSGNFVKALLEKDSSYAKLVELITRGKAAGYNGIVVNAGGSGSFASLAGTVYHKDFYTNFADLVARAQAAQMELIPVGLTPESIATLDPSIIEAFPVQARPFVVSGTTAVSTGTDLITNPGFESGSTGWGLFDGIGLDNTIGHASTTSVKIDEGSGKKMMRLYREVTGLQPFTAYRMSFWIKSSDFDAPLRLQIYDSNTVNPVYANASSNLGLGTTNGQWNADGNSLAQTQDWKEYNIDFNTLGNKSVRIYLGTWGTGTHTGAAWIDDVHVREIGLAHTVRRPSLPIQVRAASGGTLYQEGADYVVGTEKLTIPAGSQIHDGDHLSVSWAQSSRGVATLWGAPASACYQNFFDKSKTIVDETWKLLNHPKGFFIYYDEWRIMNWDSTCGPMTAGDYLGRTVEKVENSIYALNPDAEIYIWNDMFDPYQNALSSYWMVNGDMRGAVQRLNRKTIVMNWNILTNQQVNSLQYFSGQGFKQMLALYYDDKTLAATDKWLANLDLAEKNGVTGVDGFMFTTWQGDGGYADLEKVADFIKTKYPQRWPQDAGNMTLRKSR